MSKIQWTDETWNPLRARRRDGMGKEGWACVRVSPGCVNCYAATQNRTTWAGGTGLDYTVPALAKVETYVHDETLSKPLHWRKARRVFVCSMTDLFGDWVTDAQIDAVFGVMSAARRHTFQVLTKRPERMRAYLDRFQPTPAWDGYITRDGVPSNEVGHGARIYTPAWWPLPNVWLGTSVEDQQRANERIPALLETPAAVRFLSCEPLLGPIDLYDAAIAPLQNVAADGRIDWVIVGGESGVTSRPMDLAWARALVDQCKAAGVAVFVKQLGTKPMGEWGDANTPKHWLTDITKRPTTTTLELSKQKNGRWKLSDRKGGSPSEWPSDLRVREWPVSA